MKPLEDYEPGITREDFFAILKRAVTGPKTEDKKPKLGYCEAPVRISSSIANPRFEGNCPHKAAWYAVFHPDVSDDGGVFLCRTHVNWWKNMAGDDCFIEQIPVSQALAFLAGK